MNSHERLITLGEKEKAVWHTFAGNGINGVLARLIEYYGGPKVSSSNLALRSRGRAEALQEAAMRAIETLQHDQLPPWSEWGEIDTEKKTSILSGFQTCLPTAEEQEFLQSELLAFHEAKIWSRESNIDVAPRMSQALIKYRSSGSQ